jgi:protein transport protein SEC61 subunit gamma-like protein
MKIKFNLKETIAKYRRVLVLAKKPTKEELIRTSRICGIGFLVMGVMGFVFYLISVIFGA